MAFFLPKVEPSPARVLTQTRQPFTTLRQLIGPNQAWSYLYDMHDHQKTLVASLLGYAAWKDIDIEQLCQLSHIDPAQIRQQATLSLTPKQIDALWLNATYLSHDPLFGLHFGESMQLTALGVVGGLLQHSRTIGEALTHAAAFTRLITDTVEMEVGRDHDTFTIRFLPNEVRQREAPAVFRQQMDLFMAFALHEVDGLTLRRVQPRTVAYPDITGEGQQAELRRVFRCHTIRETDGYAMVFDGSFWEEPILMANYKLQGLLLSQVNAMNQQFMEEKSVSERIRTFLLANAYLGIPSLDDMAANLNSSTRNLQRKLQKEGLTYQQLADSVRKSLALHYLDSGKHPVKEISYIPGYNETSAFTRAFKRWTGTAPMDYRRRA